MKRLRRKAVVVFAVACFVFMAAAVAYRRSMAVSAMALLENDGARMAMDLDRFGCPGILRTERSSDLIVMEGAHFNDRHVSLLRNLPSIVAVELRGASVSGVGVNILAQLDLSHIVLTDCPVSDSTLQRLTSSRGLNWVNLSGTRVTSVTCNRLARLPSLESLDLSRSNVTEIAQQPSQFPRLTTMWLDSLALSPNSFEHLSMISSLEYLSLRRTSVADRDIESFTNLVNLTELDLRDTAITDVAIPALAKLPQLRYLYLTGSQVSASGAGALRKLAPGIDRVDWCPDRNTDHL